MQAPPETFPDGEEVQLMDGGAVEPPPLTPRRRMKCPLLVKCPGPTRATMSCPEDQAQDGLLAHSHQQPDRNVVSPVHRLAQLLAQIHCLHQEVLLERVLEFDRRLNRRLAGENSFYGK